MTTMVEKVARVLCSQEGEDPNQETPYHPKVTHLWQHYVPSARAAIEAMGPMMDEPDTLSAVLHDFDHLRPTFRREPNSAFREFWHTAVRKALSEEPAE